MNINGNISCLENVECIRYIKNFDIVVLIELKCSYVFAVPGFNVIRSAERESRGAVAVLISSVLWRHVRDVDTRRDQVWFRLDIVPDWRFGACYVPPADSLYFSPQSFADVQEQSSANDRMLVIGDFNSRMPNLSVFDDQARGVVYTNNVDNGTNAHGRELTSLCKWSGLYPVNHLTFNGKYLAGGVTFRKREAWISQIDWCFCSSEVIPCIRKFSVLGESPLLGDHAALAVDVEVPGPCVDLTLERARLLNAYPEFRPEVARRPVSFCSIRQEMYRNEAFPNVDEWWRDQERRLEQWPADPSMELVSDLCSNVTETIYQACQRSSQRGPQPEVQGNIEAINAHSRWGKLLSLKDPKVIWKAINWKGIFEPPGQSNEGPSDLEFASHFEKLLSPIEGGDIEAPIVDMYVPVLDDPITVQEIAAEVKRQKRNKAAGTDGIPPGALKLLSDEWLTIICILFNGVFSVGYPAQWSIAKMFTIFKKGDKLDTGNYRGISIQVALAKLYEAVLNRRFCLWFKPDLEQAGGQEGRGCPEQLVTLRLLIDYARKSKEMLYVMFIDYVKAYDQVDRNVLLQLLAAKGCGNMYLQAIANSFRNTGNLKGKEQFISYKEVKQGAANSCALFTFYINETIRKLKEFGEDGFLGDMHSLLFMDDTVVLATSREAMQTAVSGC